MELKVIIVKSLINLINTITTIEAQNSRGSGFSILRNTGTNIQGQIQLLRLTELNLELRAYRDSNNHHIFFFFFMDSRS